MSHCRQLSYLASRLGHQVSRTLLIYSRRSWRRWTGSTGTALSSSVIELARLFNAIELVVMAFGNDDNSKLCSGNATSSVAGGARKSLPRRKELKPRGN